MAKELPYFKFEPAEYLTKDISFCSLSAQGLFINICSYYWQRGCILNKEQLLRRLNYPKELDELISEGIIDLIENNISIKFLNYQLLDVEKTSKVNSSNGSKGGRPKKNPIESEPISEIKPKKNPIESEPISEIKGIREEEIKEDNIILDNISFKENAKKDFEWINLLSISNLISENEVLSFLDDFDLYLPTIKKVHPDLSEYQKHFSNWTNKKIKDRNSLKIKNNGKSNITDTDEFKEFIENARANGITL